MPVVSWPACCRPLTDVDQGDHRDSCEDCDDRLVCCVCQACRHCPRCSRAAIPALNGLRTGSEEAPALFSSAPIKTRCSNHHVHFGCEGPAQGYRAYTHCERCEQLASDQLMIPWSLHHAWLLTPTEGPSDLTEISPSCNPKKRSSSISSSARLKGRRPPRYTRASRSAGSEACQSVFCASSGAALFPLGPVADVQSPPSLPSFALTQLHAKSQVHPGSIR